MSIDCRTRLHRNSREIPRDEVFDAILPEAIARNGELAAQGLLFKELPPLVFAVGGRSVSLRERNGALAMEPGEATGATVAALDEGGLSNLIQDRQTTMGLAMTSKVEITRGAFDAWIGWEPVFRALLDARPVYQPGSINLRDQSDNPLDLTRSFGPNDDREEISHFLHEAGFLHITGVFSAQEMANVAEDLDRALAEAEPDDGASWWAGDSKGRQQAVRVLWFHNKSESLRALLADERLHWLAHLTGDSHDGSKMGAEGLTKPLDIHSGLSDLPWHKDCGQGMHSYRCNGMTVGISVTGADRQSGALGVVPGSHRANVQTAGLDPSLDLLPIKLETRTGDITVHCSDTLHRAHRPTERPRKVVYTSFQLAPKPGDVVPEPSKEDVRAERAQLTNVRDRIAASGGGVEA
ncbi:MAG: phytanoyl-CoA dioxygenase family protein [Deltaproteobacteria bacterium]|nr:phytanoyl-CoA dioxygenase family protein [Deltaproteobacteria bacterium]MBW2387905.1 phytanoyl-CoA dioxygenase family protein [Deltaproteobacteria bacterium]MBW2724658.1 phytanoyl-CoA dioxygenase family protein [Deltaproteobacteria bacterium]